MANMAHIGLLTQGKNHFSQWRIRHPNEQLDLSGINLSKQDLSRFDLRKADFSDSRLFNTNLEGANLRGAHFYHASMKGAELSKTDLTGADLTEANFSSTRLNGAVLDNVNFSAVNLSRADLSEAVLSYADLSKTNLAYANFNKAVLHGANLSQANLMGATLVDTDLSEAILTDCRIHGISVWRVNLQGAKQESLIITRDDEPTITVDNLKVAQFIYLLLNNQEIRDVIKTITYKVVLILGRFTPERKTILDAIRNELRNHNYLPVLFDFERTPSRDITETISTLAHIARFVVADITDARSIPQELITIIPNLPSVPVQPLILTSQQEYGMFEHFRNFPWVLPVYRYSDEASLLQSLEENVISPAEQKAQDLANR
jgi:uncharacterized protein YjbI with pentapeptide repeats